ncbi:hypothetical protein HY522_11160 [bacterium]|nr:hypothetical protein [bacterium]
MASFPYLPYSKKGRGSKGLPVAILGVKSIKGFWLDIDVIVDSGADFTYLPGKVGRELGISLNKDCRPIKSHGVGGSAAGHFCEKPLSCRIGSTEFSMSVVFSSNDAVPPLLGRFQGLDRFRVCMDGKTSAFSKIRPGEV